MGLARKCADCPAEVAAVCRHAFGAFWGGKSGGGEGCCHPMDGVAEAWRRAGWTPDAPRTRETAVVSVPFAGGVIALACPSDAPTGVPGAPGAVPPKMPRRPSRPKVSASIRRQAELFFGRGA